MSRWLWPWSNCVKERVCRYLLHHYLGHFFQEHLSLDQLSLDLYKGSVVLRDIHLEIDLGFSSLLGARLFLPKEMQKQLWEKPPGVGSIPHWGSGGVLCPPPPLLLLFQLQGLLRFYSMRTRGQAGAGRS